MVAKVRTVSQLIEMDIAVGFLFGQLPTSEINAGESGGNGGNGGDEGR